MPRQFHLGRPLLGNPGVGFDPGREAGPFANASNTTIAKFDAKLNFDLFANSLVGRPGIRSGQPADQEFGFLRRRFSGFQFSTVCRVSLLIVLTTGTFLTLYSFVARGCL